MTSLFGGRGTEDGRIASALAPGDMDGDRRAMTLPGLLGAWMRRLRSPAFRPGSSRRGRDRSDRPDSPGCASAAGRSIAGALDGVCRVSRAVVPALVCLALLAGVAPQASAQTLPTVSFKHYRPWLLASIHETSHGGGCLEVRLDKAPTSDIKVKYTVGGTATPGSDFTIVRSGTMTVRAGRKTGHICVSVIDDSVPESSETIILQLVGDANYRVGSNGKLIMTPGPFCCWSIW